MNYSIVFGQCTMKQFQLSNVMCENFHSCNSLATQCGYNILALAWGKQFYRQPFYIDCLPSYHVSRSSWQIETRGKTFLSHKLPPVSNHPVPGKTLAPWQQSCWNFFFLHQRQKALSRTKPEKELDYRVVLFSGSMHSIPFGFLSRGRVYCIPIRLFLPLPGGYSWRMTDCCCCGSVWGVSGGSWKTLPLSSWENKTFLRQGQSGKEGKVKCRNLLQTSCQHHHRHHQPHRRFGLRNSK